MDTKISIEGAYIKEGASYFHQHGLFKLVKGFRTPRSTKTAEFLILKTCCDHETLPDGSKERYVSGIFWITSNTFRIDFNGVRYTCSVTEDGFSIRPLHGGQKFL